MEPEPSTVAMRSSLALARAIRRLSFFLCRLKSCLLNLRQLLNVSISLPISERDRFKGRSDKLSMSKCLLVPKNSLTTGSGEGEGNGGIQSGIREGQGAPNIVECLLQLEGFLQTSEEQN
jgi:hypothetical protein